MTKTNAMRLLDQKKIPYSTAQYDYDEQDLSGLHAAQAIGLAPERVFKTLVAKGERQGYLVFCIPVCCELDLKKAAKAAGDKKVDLIAMKELLPVTGYLRGGCSPIGMKKKFPTYIDETCTLFEQITVSAGVRGCQLLLSAEELISFTDAAVCDITVTGGGA